jgi:CheY-like chemotaxis protein
MSGQPSPSDHAGMRIILVEDDPDVRNFLHRVMCRIVPDAELSIAENGHEALASFEQGGADLIISDHWMPQMSGLELLRHLRLTSKTPVVMISADITAKNDLLDAGASAFLFKPLSIAQLREVVQQFLT